MSFKSNHKCPYNKKTEGTGDRKKRRKHIDRGESNMQTKAEIGMIQPHAKESPASAATRNWKKPRIVSLLDLQ